MAARLIIASLCVAAIVLMSCRPSRSPESVEGDPSEHTGSQSPATVDQLVRAIQSLPAWPADGTFGQTDWQEYLNVAQMIAATPSDVVEESLDTFIRGAQEHNFRGAYEEESKPFLLLRVVFDLPEEAAPSALRPFKGWTNWDDAKQPSGKVNMAWPIDWNKGAPRLLSGYRGSVGQPYMAAMEYHYFRERYSVRSDEGTP